MPSQLARSALAASSRCRVQLRQLGAQA
jgi:hypothetical protein